MSSRALLAIIACVISGALCAQETPLDPHRSIKINLPSDSPLSLLTADMGESRASARGGAIVLDLHLAIRLRNSSYRRVRGVTFLVLAQEVTPGGKASVTVPSLDVRPGDAFPMRIDLRLLRPLQASAGPLVEVSLDGVLFHDLSFYGPNRLNSRRSMTVWETEAQRDRTHFRSVLAALGPEGLRREMLDSLARQASRPRLDVQVARNGRSVSSAASSVNSGPEHLAEFAFLKFPDAPVQPVDGWAEIAGNEARAPRIHVVNRSSRPVRYVEIGWIVRDRQGREFLAASVPASDRDMLLPPGRTGRVLQDTALRFSQPAGEPLIIDGMTGFVSQVEYDNGTVWIPNRASLQNALLLRLLAPSPEEQRLTDLYRKKGLPALIEELKTF